MLRQIFAVTIKDLKIFFKDPGAVALTFLMPFMFVVVMSYALAGPFGSAGSQTVKLLLVDEDGGKLAGLIRTRLAALEGFEIETTQNGQLLNRSSLEEIIRAEDRSFGLILPHRLSRSSLDAIPTQVLLMVHPSTPAQIVEPVSGVLQGFLNAIWIEWTLPARVDEIFPALGIEIPEMLKNHLKKQIHKNIQDFFAPENQPILSMARTAPRGMQAVSIPDPWQQNVPGYTLFGIFWIVVLLTESVQQERRNSTFGRMMVSPMRRSVILAGKLLPYYLINLMQITLMLTAARLLFGLQLGQSLVGLIMVSLSAALSATGLGVMVSSLARTEAQARGLTILILLTLSALGGCFVPRFVMPDLLRNIGLLTPHAWALDAYLELLVKDGGLMDVLPEIGILMVFASVFFFVGVRRFRLV